MFGVYGNGNDFPGVAFTVYYNMKSSFEYVSEFNHEIFQPGLISIMD